MQLSPSSAACELENLSQPLTAGGSSDVEMGWIAEVEEDDEGRTNDERGE